jgi:hypothetical protein
MCGCTFDFGKGFAATFTDGGITQVLAYMSGIIPAAVALLALGSKHFDMKGFWVFTVHWGIKRQHFYLRND